MDKTPTLEETLQYNQAKAILRAPCVVVAQLYPRIKTITEYEEKFDILEEERFKSAHLKLNGRDEDCALLKPLCSIQPKFTPIIVELVPEKNEHVEFIKENEFVPDPLNKKCYGVVPFFRLDDKIWKYVEGMGDGYNAKYISGDWKKETFNFGNEEFRNSITPVIPSQWLELEGYKTEKRKTY
jgi:hypothetical protein